MRRQDTILAMSYVST